MTWRETWSRSIAKHPNGLTTQCGINDIWNQSQGSPCNCGRTQSQLSHRKHPPPKVKDNDIRRAVIAITAVPAATLPESAFILALGTPALRTVPPQTGSLAQRAIEEWERNLCENKAVAILEEMQAGRPALIKKDGEEMLIAIVLDRPLAEAEALVEGSCKTNRIIQLLHKWSGRV